MNGLFSYLGEYIDGALNVFVTTVSSNLSIAITPLVTTGFTIYILMYGLAVMRHEVSEPVSAFMGKALKIGLILGFALGSGLYQSEIVAGVKALESGLVNVVAPNSIGTDVYGMLDAFDAKTSDMALTIVSRGMALLPFNGWMDMIVGLVVFVANSVLLIVCGGFIVMAKVATGLILGLGPIFIACLAFPPTAKFFDAWVAKVLNYLLLVVILAFNIALTIKLCDDYVTRAMASLLTSSTNQLGDAFGMVVLYGSLLFVIYQSPQIASGLAGGAALSGGGILGKLMGGSTKSGGGSGGNSGGEGSDGGGSVKNGGVGGQAGGGGGETSARGSMGPSKHRRAMLDNLNRNNK
jgi:type IV secretion system protein VirB6